MFSCHNFNFPILCTNPFPMHWADRPGWLPGTVEVCEAIIQELNITMINSSQLSHFVSGMGRVWP